MPGVMDIVVRATDNASSVIEGVSGTASRSVENIQRSMQRTGTIMSAAVTAPLLLLANSTTDAASSLNESINAVNVVFGDAADKVLAFGRTAHESAGLSARAFNQLVTPVGAALQNVGFSADEAADASINLGVRAADMASVFDVDVADALGAIQAGLRGEADPLERFGVGLSDAAVRAHGVELGLAATAAELDANALAQARLSLLMAQTDTIAGDFANTSGDVANAERSVGAEAENTAAALGQKLIPIKQALIGALGTLLDLWKGLSPEMQTAILVVAGVVAAMGPLLLIGSQLITVIKGIGIAMAFVAANPIVLIIAAIVALVAALVWLWHNNETFREIVTNVWNAVSGAIGAVVGAVGAYFGTLGAGIGVLVGVFETVRDTVATVFGAVRNVIRSVVSWVLDRFEEIGRGIDAVIGFFRDMKDRVVGFVKGLADAITAPFRFIGDVLNTINPFARHSPSLVDNVREGVRLIAREYASLADMQIGAPTLGTAAVGVGGSAELVGLLRSIDHKLDGRQQLSVDGRALANALGGPLVEEIRNRTGL